MLAHNALVQFIDKLERRGPLPTRERDAVLALRGTHQNFAANQTLVAAGDRTGSCIIMESGLLSRVKLLADGARQIVAFHVPGDAVDLQTILFTRSDHDIVSHVPTRTYWVAHEDILALTEDYPVLARALWLDTLVDAAIFREWTVNVGQRNARARIAHLFLEIAARLDAIGQLRDDTFDLPVTQTSLADALGLSLVHMNKSLQSLRRGGLIEMGGRRISILRREDLVQLCGFSAHYLHLDGAQSKEIATSRGQDAGAEAGA